MSPSDLILKRGRRASRSATASPRLRLEELEQRLALSSSGWSGPVASLGSYALAGHQTIHVHRGDSIQAAVDAANPGAVILIDPAVYTQSVTIDKPGIHLVGLRGPAGDGVVLANPGGDDDGITVTPNGAGVELRDLTVCGFGDNGVILNGVVGFTITRITAADNGEYGLFPVLSAGGIISGCVASGHADTGIYVGLSSDVVVTHCEAFDNVIGIEVENSTRVSVRDSVSHDNTAGILVDLLPGLPVTTATDNTIAHDRVFNNNHANFADPGSLESFVPQGSGIMIVGADRTAVRDNRVTHNDFFGVALLSDEFLIAIGALPPGSLQGIDPNPDGTRIVDNIVLHNGTSSPIAGVPAADLLWDGSGTDNLWHGNRYGTSAPGQLPGGG